jgi:hypothetical protein
MFPRFVTFPLTNTHSEPPDQAATATLQEEGVAAEPTLVLTGHRRDDHFEILFNQTPVTLTRTHLRALVQLVLARGARQTGLLRLPRVTICRLRQALDSVGGPGTGKQVIQTGCGEEYRLRPDTVVILVASFLELIDLGITSPQEVEVLRGLCRADETGV